MHRCDNANSAGTATGKYDGSVKVYRDENPPSYDATQLRHQEMNALQEEIANVIRGEGIALQSDTETAAQMFQLETAINNKLKATRIVNDSGVTGAYVDDALNTLDGYIGALDSDDIANVSGVSGASVSNALDNLDTDIGNLKFVTDAQIRGFPLYITRTNRKYITINGEGSCADTTGLYPIKKGVAAFSKEIINTGGTAWESFVVGANNGGAPSGIEALFNTFTGDINTGSPTITNISDTSMVMVGDCLVGGSNWDNANLIRVISKTSNSVTVHRNASGTSVGASVALAYRAMPVFVIGQSSDDTKYDMGIDNVLTAANLLSDAGGSWDIFRRIGQLIVWNNAGSFEMLPMISTEDVFTFTERYQLENNLQPNTSPSYSVVSVPLVGQVWCRATLDINWTDSSGTGAAWLYAWDCHDDPTTPRDQYDWALNFSGGYVDQWKTRIVNLIQTLADKIQYFARNSGATTSPIATVYMLGFVDPRL